MESPKLIRLSNGTVRVDRHPIVAPDAIIRADLAACQEALAESLDAWRVIADAKAELSRPSLGMCWMALWCGACSSLALLIHDSLTMRTIAVAAAFLFMALLLGAFMVQTRKLRAMLAQP